ncbi:MAG: RNA-binding domain-containing protein, partial [Candidatus Methanoperedens sp.]
IESLVAFANTRGGVIFIGVSDKNNIKGLNIGKETINQWVNQISQSTELRLIPEIEKIQQYCMKAELPESVTAYVLKGHNGANGVTKGPSDINEEL